MNKIPKYVVCEVGKIYEVCNYATIDENTYYKLIKDGIETGYFNSNGFISLEEFRSNKLKEIGI